MATACTGTNQWVPPLLLPGMDDCAWCVTSCGPCEPMRRRFAECDYIEITPFVKKTFIRMLSSVQSPMQVNPARQHIKIEIKRRGCETAIACYDAFQRTADGYVGFYWDSAFTGTDPGLYVGDVFIECIYCFSIHFRVPRCEMVVDSCYNEYAAEDCGLGECAVIDAMGEGTVGGTTCPVTSTSECGTPAPYFETADPAIPDMAPPDCNLQCQPAFTVTGDVLTGTI